MRIAMNLSRCVIVLSTALFISLSLSAVVTSYPYSESFEKDFGVWAPEMTNDFNWERITGQTPSSGTGPLGAYDRLWYIYTEASGNNPNYTASLFADFDLTPLTKPMLRFYYHMYGNSMGTLYIDVDDGSGATTVWTLAGEQQTWVTDAWRRAEVDLSAYTGASNVMIRIRGVTGPSYTSDMCVDKVQMIDDVPRIELDPVNQEGEGLPGKGVNYNLTAINKTLTSTDFNISYYNNPWSTLGPVTTGMLTNNQSDTLIVQVQVPGDAYAGDQATSTLQFVSTDNTFTGLAHIVTICTWTTHPLPCETWDIFPHGWTNYSFASTIFPWLQSGIGNPAPGLYHPAYTATFTNWFVSPAINLDDPFAEELRLSFDEFIIINEGYGYTGVLISEGNRNPASNDFVELLEIGDTSLNWVNRKIDLSAYRGANPVYIAFEYIGSNAHLPFIDNVCVRGQKFGIDNSFFDSPTSAVVFCAQDAPEFKGLLYIDGQTGPDGPAARITAQVGFGTPGTIPGIDPNWLWHSAQYTGPDGIYDAFEATPLISAAGTFDTAYRYRIGDAGWVYADIDGSSNGYDVAHAGHLTVLPHDIPGDIIYEQTMNGFGWYTSVLYSNSMPAQPVISTDDISLPVDTRIDGLRWYGVYDFSARRGDVIGFLVRFYRNDPSNDVAIFDHPGPVVFSEYHPGFACEQLFTNMYGINHFLYQLELNTPFQTGPGRYWVSVQIVALSNDFEWYMLNTEDPITGSPALQYYQGAWYEMYSDLGFQLLGSYLNHGVLTGTVTAAHSGQPIHRAVVGVNGPTNLTVQTADDGTYTLLAPLGTYDAYAAKKNYVTGIVSGVSFTSQGQEVGQDFSLTGSLLTYGPPVIEEVVWVGEVVTNTVSVTNSGPFDVNYFVGITDFGANTSQVSSPPPVNPVNLPRFTGTLPASDVPHSIGPPPAEVTDELSPLALPTMSTVTGVKAFGTEIRHTNLFQFYTGDPGVITNIGKYGANFVWASDFLPHGLNTLYAIRDNNQFIAINVTNAKATVLGMSVPSPGQSWTGMAGDPDGTLYACSTDINKSELYRIDPSDGTATLIGPIVNSPGIIAIGINAEGRMYGHDIVNDSLMSINKYTAVGTIIGPLGFNANFGQGMDFDYESGICYLAAFNQNTGPELRIADLATGNTTNVGAFTVGQVGSMAVATEPPPSWAIVPTNQGSIAAGGTGTIDVIFDSNVVSNLGSYFAHLTFYGNFVNHPEPVDLIMHIADGPQITAPPVIDYGGVYMDTSTSIPLPVKNIGFGSVTGALIDVNEPFSTSGDTNYILATLETKELITWFTPTVTGTFNDIAILTGTGGRKVLLTGYVLPTLDVTPDALTFPDTEIGESNQIVIICKNIGGDILSGSVTTPDSPFTLAGNTNYAIPYNDFVFYSVWFAPQGVIEYTDMLVFTGGGGATIPLSGHGIPEPLVVWVLLPVLAVLRKLIR
jgi:hypothetical protein